MITEQVYWQQLEAIRASHKEERWRQTVMQLRLLRCFSDRYALPPALRATVCYEIADLLGTFGGMQSCLEALRFLRLGTSHLTSTNEPTLFHSLKSLEAHVFFVLQLNERAQAIYDDILDSDSMGKADIYVRTETLIRSAQCLLRLGAPERAGCLLLNARHQCSDVNAIRPAFYASLRLANNAISRGLDKASVKYLEEAQQCFNSLPALTLVSERAKMAILMDRARADYLLICDNNFDMAASLLIHSYEQATQFNYSFLEHRVRADLEALGIFRM